MSKKYTIKVEYINETPNNIEAEVPRLQKLREPDSTTNYDEIPTKSRDNEEASINNDLKSIDDDVKSIDDDVKSVNDAVKSVNDDVKSIDDELKSIDDNVKTIDDDVKSEKEEMEAKGELIVPKDQNFVPVLTVTKQQAVFIKGDVKLQKVSVTEDIAVENEEAPFTSIDPIYSGIHSEVIHNHPIRLPGGQENVEDAIMPISDQEDKEVKKPRTRIPAPRLRQAAERVKRERHNSKETKEDEAPPSHQIRRSSIPRLRGSKLPSPAARDIKTSDKSAPIPAERVKSNNTSLKDPTKRDKAPPVTQRTKQTPVKENVKKESKLIPVPVKLETTTKTISNETVLPIKDDVKSDSNEIPIDFKNESNDIVKDEHDLTQSDFMERKNDPEDEFEKMFDDVVVNTPTEEVFDTIFDEDIDDSEELKTSFEGILHTYDEDEMQMIEGLRKTKPKMSLIKQKSYHNVKASKQKDRRSSLNVYEDKDALKDVDNKETTPNEKEYSGTVVEEDNNNQSDLVSPLNPDVIKPSDEKELDNRKADFAMETHTPARLQNVIRDINNEETLETATPVSDNDDQTTQAVDHVANSDIIETNRLDPDEDEEPMSILDINIPSSIDDIRDVRDTATHIASEDDLKVALPVADNTVNVDEENQTTLKFNVTDITKTKQDKAEDFKAEISKPLQEIDASNVTTSKEPPIETSEGTPISRDDLESDKTQNNDIIKTFELEQEVPQSKPEEVRNMIETETSTNKIEPSIQEDIKQVTKIVTVEKVCPAPEIANKVDQDNYDTDNGQAAKTIESEHTFEAKPTEVVDDKQNTSNTELPPEIKKPQTNTEPKDNIATLISDHAQKDNLVIDTINNDTVPNQTDQNKPESQPEIVEIKPTPEEKKIDYVIEDNVKTESLKTVDRHETQNNPKLVEENDNKDNRDINETIVPEHDSLDLSQSNEVAERIHENEIDEIQGISEVDTENTINIPPETKLQETTPVSEGIEKTAPVSQKTEILYLDNNNTTINDDTTNIPEPVLNNLPQTTEDVSKPAPEKPIADSDSKTEAPIEKYNPPVSVEINEVNDKNDKEIAPGFKDDEPQTTEDASKLLSENPIGGGNDFKTEAPNEKYDLPVAVEINDGNNMTDTMIPPGSKDDEPQTTEDVSKPPPEKPKADSDSNTEAPIEKYNPPVSVDINKVNDMNENEIPRCEDVSKLLPENPIGDGSDSKTEAPIEKYDLPVAVEINEGNNMNDNLTSPGSKDAEPITLENDSIVNSDRTIIPHPDAHDVPQPKTKVTEPQAPVEEQNTGVQETLEIESPIVPAEPIKVIDDDTAKLTTPISDDGERDNLEIDKIEPEYSTSFESEAVPKPIHVDKEGPDNNYEPSTTEQIVIENLVDKATPFFDDSDNINENKDTASFVKEEVDTTEPININEPSVMPGDDARNTVIVKESVKIATPIFDKESNVEIDIVEKDKTKLDKNQIDDHIPKLVDESSNSVPDSARMVQNLLLRMGSNTSLERDSKITPVIDDSLSKDEESVTQNIASNNDYNKSVSETEPVKSEDEDIVVFRNKNNRINNKTVSLQQSPEEAQKRESNVTLRKLPIRSSYPTTDKSQKRVDESILPIISQSHRKSLGAIPKVKQTQFQVKESPKDAPKLITVPVSKIDKLDVKKVNTIRKDEKLPIKYKQIHPISKGENNVEVKNVPKPVEINTDTEEGVSPQIIQEDNENLEKALTLIEIKETIKVIPTPKGKVSTIISKINTNDKDIPKKKALTSRIAMFENQSPKELQQKILKSNKESDTIKNIDQKPKIIDPLSLQPSKGKLDSKETEAKVELSKDDAVFTNSKPNIVDETPKEEDNYLEMKNDLKDDGIEERKTNKQLDTNDKKAIEDENQNIIHIIEDVIATDKIESTDSNDVSVSEKTEVKYPDTEKQPIDIKIDNETALPVDKEVIKDRELQKEQLKPPKIGDRIRRMQSRTEDRRLRSKSTADIELGDAVKGRVQQMIVRINSMENLLDIDKKEPINVKETPRKRSVLDKIALFENKHLPGKWNLYTRGHPAIKVPNISEDPRFTTTEAPITGAIPGSNAKNIAEAPTPSEYLTTTHAPHNSEAPVRSEVLTTTHAPKTEASTNTREPTTSEAPTTKAPITIKRDSVMDPIATVTQKTWTEDDYVQRIEELKNAKTKYGDMSNMLYMKLNDSKDMPILALGTALLDPRLVKPVIGAAIDLGYRAFDTAFIYGNEQAVGEAIRAKIEDGTVTRADLFITNKLWSTYHRQDLVEAACRASLDAMGLEYFDLYLIHNPMSFKEGAGPLPKIANVLQYSSYDYMDAWYGMERLQTKGLVKSIGVSNFNATQITRVYEKSRAKPVINQVECHPYLTQQRLDQVCAERDVKLCCFGILGSKGTPAHLKGSQASVIDDPMVVVMAAGMDITPAQMLIRYQIQSGHSAVLKATSASHLREGLLALTYNVDSATIDALSALNKNKRAYTFKGMGDTHRNYPFKDLF